MQALSGHPSAPQRRLEAARARTTPGNILGTTRCAHSSPSALCSIDRADTAAHAAAPRGRPRGSPEPQQPLRAPRASPKR